MAGTVWKGHLSFGLVNIPIKLVRAARPERVNLHRLHRAAAPTPQERPASVLEFPAPGRAAAPAPEPEAEPREPAPVERVRQAAITESEQRPLRESELVKGYEYQPEQWVVLDREELKNIAPKTSATMQISEFVRFGEIDPVYFEASYYVLPDRSGEKAYAVLYEALRQTNFAAVAEVAMHNREHIVILRPGRTGLIAHTMFFENEVRKQDEHRTDTALAAGRELDLAKMLVESLAGPFQPEKYRDTYKEKLEALIAAKTQGGEVAATEAAPAARAEVSDLIAALEKSLEASRKPPERAEPPKKRTGRRLAGRSGS